MDRRKLLENPYRPGAGHPPPHLAGRTAETDYFIRLMRQGFASENILITGLRGVGKTVLLDRMRTMAQQEGWLWIGNDLSESSSLSEDRLALRIITDLSEAFSRVLAGEDKAGQAVNSEIQGREQSEQDAMPYAFDALRAMYERSPGLPSDKLRSIITRLGTLVKRAKVSGLIFAYDEAQCLSDHAGKDEYPMSVLRLSGTPILQASAFRYRSSVARHEMKHLLIAKRSISANLRETPGSTRIQPATGKSVST